MDGLKSARAIALQLRHGRGAMAATPRGAAHPKTTAIAVEELSRAADAPHTACAALVSAFTELFSLVLNAVRDRRAVFRLFVIPKFLSNWGEQAELQLLYPKRKSEVKKKLKSF